MTLGELIAVLERCDQKVVLHGFHRPHPYRGNYADVAFMLADNISVADMLADAKFVLGDTFTGYKGVKFTMDESTDVYLAERGCTGEALGPRLLDYILKEEASHAAHSL